MPYPESPSSCASMYRLVFPAPGTRKLLLGSGVAELIEGEDISRSLRHRDDSSQPKAAVGTTRIDDCYRNDPKGSVAAQRAAETDASEAEPAASAETR